MAGSILAIIGDTHIGSSTAVSPLTYALHNRNSLETQIVEANRLQRWLYEAWTDYWQYVFSLQGKGKHKRRLIIAHLGDVVDGVHHGSTQLVAEINDQMQMAYDLLKPVRKKASTFIGIFGTGPSHAGMDNSTEAAIYNELDADYVGQQLTISIDGTLCDLAHHGRAGMRPWTSGAVALGAEVMLDCAQSGVPLPDYIFRGHRHVMDDSGAKFEYTRVIQCPSFQLKTSYGWGISANTIRSDIGGVILVDGQLDLSKSRYHAQPDGRKVVVI
jgi:hypothetical protein